MLDKLFNRENLVELDNITNNVIVLAECFIASEILKTKSKIMSRYIESGNPLSLDIAAYSLVGEDVECKGTILDKEERVISTMSLKYENGRVKSYEITLKGKLKGKKIRITESTEKSVINRRCYTIDIVNTLQRLASTIRKTEKCSD